MNYTGEYYDQLDGDFLACKPGNVAEGLEFICTIGNPGVGSVYIVNAVWVLGIAFTTRRTRQHVADQTRIGVDKTNAQTSRTTNSDKYSSYAERVMLASGLNLFFIGLCFIVYGWGTMYPTTHIRGQIGDMLTGIHGSVLAYLTLLQQRGAKSFKALIPDQQNQKRGSLTFKFAPRVIRRRLEFVLYLGIYQVFWLLLRLNIMSRAWFCFCYSGANAVLGSRAVLIMLSVRLATLKRVAAIAQEQRGARDLERRREGFLKNKTIGLVIDLCAVSLFATLWPASVLLAGSSFSSQQLALHLFIANIPYAVVMSFTTIHMHKKNQAAKRKHAVALGTALATGLGGSRSILSSNPTGGSDVRAHW
jgi:hypothetical protein